MEGLLQEYAKEPVNILELFEQKSHVKVCAPMVRYSKLQFRNLVRSYGCDICYTPMILADSFCLSDKARRNEFTTNLKDTALITQFAANNVHDFVGAAYMVSPDCDGVDLNCGCPQRWAKQKGIGCIMLENPQLIYDIVRSCRNIIKKPFTVSVKLRLLKDLRQTVEICKQLEKCGVSFLTIHARTPDQNTGDINKEALQLITSSVGVPVIANGGLKSLAECNDLADFTRCKGTMVANGILTNPALFSGASSPPLECVKRWIDICYNSTLLNRTTNLSIIAERPANLTFQCFHHHLVFMLEKALTRAERRVFNNLQHFEPVFEFLYEKFGIKPEVFNEGDFEKSKIIDVDYGGRGEVYNGLISGEKKDDTTETKYSSEESHGKFFRGKVTDQDEDCDWADFFGDG